MKERYEQWLKELTGMPTASGREDRVIQWIDRWVGRRKHLMIKRDRYGNMLIQRLEAKSTSPVIFTAHIDHPAFVVDRVIDSQTIEGEFRGGVQDGYFLAGPPEVVLHRGSRAVKGQIAAFRPAQEGGLKGARIELNEPADAQLGDVVTWSVGEPRINGDRFDGLGCDDLASAAAAFCAMDRLGRSRSASPADVRLLITRAEEVGFIGAIGACKSGLLPKRAQVVNLECSRSFADSPIGGGPIVRVGDRTSTFDPGLTHRMTTIARELSEADAAFRFQRKLMPGGTCEASAFLAYGYTASCVCLPLGNYHNMNEESGRIAAEYISLSDYHCMIALLVKLGQRLSGGGEAPPFRARLDELFASRKYVLSEKPVK